MAGESAREYARRQREKAERHLRVAERFERGAEGEEATGVQLDALRQHGWVVFHDVRWPGRPRANIDHVVIGPGGVFVVDSKNWSGRIEVMSNVLLQNGRPREEAVVGTGEAALAVTRLLGQVPVTGVLCFVREEPLTGWARDVMICSTSTVASMLSSRPRALHPAAVRRFETRLQRGLASATEQPPMGSRGTRKPTTAPRSRPKQANRRRSRRRSPVGALVGVGMIVAALIWGVPLAQRVATSAIAGIATTSLRPAQPLRTTVSVSGANGRPQLRVTALRVVDARPLRRDEHAVPSDQKLVAVDVRIENDGAGRWGLDTSGAAWTVTDSEGLEHHPSSLRRVNLGRTLSPSSAVPAHREVHGRLVFALPRTASASQIRLSVGAGTPGTALWRVGP
jgi:hypothetical protein